VATKIKNARRYVKKVARTSKRGLATCFFIGSDKKNARVAAHDVSVGEWFARYCTERTQ
jgi:hypothetical protein